MRQDFGKPLLLAILVTLCLLGMGYRMTLGVDLTDEAYYATYLDGWLKNGLQASQYLGVHQTAELLILPFAILYRDVRGSEVGLMLFLRYIYLCFAIAGALSLFQLLHGLKGSLIAAAAGGVVLVFIPFGLPAPSYNTIGMFGMVCGTSLYGTAIMRTLGEEPRGRLSARSIRPMILSAVAWMLAIVAYPTLVIPLCLLLLLSWLGLEKSQRPVLAAYTTICAVSVGCGLGLILLVFGWERLAQIVTFTNSFLGTDSIWQKVNVEAARFLHSKGYLALCIALPIGGIVAGILRTMPRLRIASDLLLTAGAASALLMSFFVSPVLFDSSHDIILLLAGLGMFFVAGAVIRPRATTEVRVMRILYGTSLLAGLITASTATNGLFNFPIGGLMAACLTLAFLVSAGEGRREPVFALHVGTLLLAVVVMAFCSYRFVYGEGSPPIGKNSTTIPSGLFAGLRTTHGTASFIKLVTGALAVNGADAKTIAVFGRFPGLYLLTPLKPRTFTTWTMGYWTTEAEQVFQSFYRNPKNQPDLIAVSTDDQVKIPAPAAERSLLAKYQLVQKISFANWAVAIYSKAAQEATTTGFPERRPGSTAPLRQ